ncbi:hypothetical protein ACFL02_09490 [Planctomycetota bacterium]
MIIAYLNFQLLIFLYAFFPTPQAEQMNQALEEAHNLARTALSVHNQQNGIEYMGGPFRFEDYQVSVRSDNSIYYKTLDVEYKYKRPHGIKGYPDEFDIIVTWKLNWPFKQVKDITVNKSELDIVGEINKKEIENILQVLPDYDLFHHNIVLDDPNAPQCIVKINSEGQITRDYRKINHIQRMQRISEDRIQVFYSMGYRRIQTFLHYRGDFRIQRDEKDSWHVASFRNSGYPIDVSPSDHYIYPLPENFILVGSLKDNFLREALDIARRTPQMYPITSIEVFDNGKKMIFSIGDASHGFPFGSHFMKIPFDSITLQKGKTEWEFLRMAHTLNLQSSLESIVPSAFPLLHSPSTQQIDEVISNVKIKGIDKKEARKIIEIVMRLRNIDRRITSLWLTKEGKVEVITGSGLGPMSESNIIEMKKVNNLWVVLALGPLIS